MISIIHPPTDAVEFVPIGSGIDAFCQTIHRRITSLRMPNQGMNGSSKVVHGFFQHHYYPSNLLYNFQQYGRPIRLHCQNTNSSLWWITKNVTFTSKMYKDTMTKTNHLPFTFYTRGVIRQSTKMQNKVQL